MKQRRAARVERASLFDLSNEEILNNIEGHKRLLRVGFPLAFSMELQKRYQTLMFAGKPVNAQQIAMQGRFVKRDRKGVAIPGTPLADGTPTVQLKNEPLYEKEATELLAMRQRVAIVPLERSKIPTRVQQPSGRYVDVIIEGEVWELLGRLLID